MKHKISGTTIIGYRQVALDEKLQKGDLLVWNSSVFMYHSGMCKNPHHYVDIPAFLKGFSYLGYLDGSDISEYTGQQYLDRAISFFKKAGYLAKDAHFPPTTHTCSIWRKGMAKTLLVKHPWQTESLPLP